jgi:hypothetical protein
MCEGQPQCRRSNGSWKAWDEMEIFVDSSPARPNRKPMRGWRNEKEYEYDH